MYKNIDHDDKDIIKYMKKKREILLKKWNSTKNQKIIKERDTILINIHLLDNHNYICNQIEYIYMPSLCSKTE